MGMDQSSNRIFREGLELIADVAQPTQPLFHVEQSGLPFHVPIPVPRQGQ
jgi:hypothetical protein